MYYIHISIDTLSGHPVRNGEVADVYDENGVTTLSCDTIEYRIYPIEKVTDYAVAFATKIGKDPEAACEAAIAKHAKRYDIYNSAEEAEAAAITAIEAFNASRA